VALPHAGILLHSLFHPEDKGDVFFRNNGLHSPDYTALYSTAEGTSDPSTFLFSPPVVGEWLASGSDRFIPRE
jgi:hypothetical protein